MTGRVILSLLTIREVVLTASHFRALHSGRLTIILAPLLGPANLHLSIGEIIPDDSGDRPSLGAAALSCPEHRRVSQGPAAVLASLSRGRDLGLILEDVLILGTSQRAHDLCSIDILRDPGLEWLLFA
jgi:hypothetical protein